MSDSPNPFQMLRADLIIDSILPEQLTVSCGTLIWVTDYAILMRAEPRRCTACALYKSEGQRIYPCGDLLIDDISDFCGFVEVKDE